jgi:hypothetical protein
VQLGAEVVDQFLVRLHARGAPVFGDGVGDVHRQARFLRALVVRPPFVLRAPVAPGDEDRELDQPVGERIAVPDVVAELERLVGGGGAAHERIERAAQVGPGPDHLAPVDVLLRCGHGIARQQRETRNNGCVFRHGAKV